MTKTFCDLWGKELEGWENFTGAFNLTLVQSCSNPLAELNFSNGNYQRAEVTVDCICYECQRKLSKAMFDVLKPILNVRGQVIKQGGE